MSPVTATTTSPPVTVVCSRASSINMTVTMDPPFVHVAASGQHDVVLPPQLIPRDKMRGYVGTHHCATEATTSVPHFIPGYANYAMGPPQVTFSFRVEPPTDSLCHMLVLVLVFAFCF